MGSLNLMLQHTGGPPLDFINLAFVRNPSQECKLALGHEIHLMHLVACSYASAWSAFSTIIPSSMKLYIYMDILDL